MKRYNGYMLIALLMLCLLPFSSVLAQKALIQGAVLDNSGTPVNNATIVVTDNPGNKVTTNKRGHFSINAQPGKKIQVSAKHYISKTVEVNEKDKELNIVLDTAVNIPVGDGLFRNGDELTSAVSMIGSKSFENQTVINVGNALYGKFPGLMVLQNGGAPPTSPTLFVRGLDTFNDNSPLILVDGFEQELSTLAASEIQNVTVLKDAAALAKYGQRGANGAILITTKRGSKNSDGLKVTASTSMGFTQPTQLPSFVGASVYAKARNETRINDGLPPLYSSADLQAFENSGSALYPNINWFNEVLRDRGARSNYNMTFQGGTGTARYFAMLNYDGDHGIFGPTERNDKYSTQLKYSRFRFRTNLDVDLTDNLLFKVDLSGNAVDHNSPGSGTGQIFSSLYSVPAAIYPVRNPDGSFGGNPSYASNPWAMLTSTGYNQPNSREFTLNGKLRQDLSAWLDGLSVEIAARYTNFGHFAEGQTQSFRYESFIPQRDQSGAIVDTTINAYGQNTDLNFYSNVNQQHRFDDVQGKIHYNNTFGENNTLDATVLFHQSTRAFEGRDNVYHRRNFFGNVHFGLKQKYFFDVSASYGGNNRLPAGQRYEIFPAVSASWMLSKESFLQDNSFIDRLKLQASWGMVGSDLLPSDNPYERYFLEGAQGYWFKDSNQYRGGFAEGHLASTKFTDEISHKTNIGIDARFLGQLDLQFNVFYDRRTNILTSTDNRVSKVLGISPARESRGIVENKGLEAALGWQHTIGKLAYHIEGQFTYARNKIVNMEEQYRPYDYLKRTGEAVGQWFGLQAIGFFKDQNDIANSPRQEFSEVQPGDIKYKDQNGDGVINEFDEVPLGYSGGAPEIYFSVDLGVNYKGFGLSALFQGTSRYTAYLNTPSVFRPMRNNNTISTYYYDRRWTPQTASSASYPRLSTNSNDNNFRPNSVWLSDNSYIKLRTLRLSYSLPASVVQPLKISNIKILLVGNNLFSIDKIPVLDPEQLAAGYPILRSYSAGLEIKF